MWRKTLIICLFFSVGLILPSASVWAACDQGDLEGAWSVEVWGGSEGGINCWDLCTLTIGADGAIASGGIYTDCYGVDSNVTGGRLTMLPNCLIQGTIVTSTTTINVGPGAITGEGQLCLGTNQ